MRDAEILKVMLLEVEQRLIANQDFQRWKALQAAIDAVSKASALGDVQAPRANLYAHIHGSAHARSANAHVINYSKQKLSHADGVVLLLKRCGYPIKTHDLLAELPSIGVMVSGKDPMINLSSSLSRDDRLESISWSGARAWWLKGMPILPPGLDNQGEVSEVGDRFELNAPTSSNAQGREAGPGGGT